MFYYKSNTLQITFQVSCLSDRSLSTENLNSNAVSVNYFEESLFPALLWPSNRLSCLPFSRLSISILSAWSPSNIATEHRTRIFTYFYATTFVSVGHNLLHHMPSISSPLLFCSSREIPWWGIALQSSDSTDALLIVLPRKLQPLHT